MFISACFLKLYKVPEMNNLGLSPNSLLGVCYLRLDFESFDINGLSASTEINTDTDSVIACQDKFTISV